MGEQPIEIGNVTGRDRAQCCSPSSPSPGLINTKVRITDLTVRKEEEGRWVVASQAADKSCTEKTKVLTVLALDHNILIILKKSS